MYVDVYVDVDVDLRSAPHFNVFNAATNRPQIKREIYYNIHFKNVYLFVLI